MSKPKYDKDTLLQLRIIEIEKRLDVLEQRSLKQYKEKDNGFSERIVTLENARQRQISINSTVDKALRRKPKPSFWSRFK